MAAVGDTLSRVFLGHRARLIAYTMRITGDLEAAEEAVQEGFLAATAQWDDANLPRNPVAWIARVAHRRAVDRLRRDRTLARKLDWLEPSHSDSEFEDDDYIADDRLRLILTCCHPVLGEDAQVALTLRVVCGISPEGIARAFAVPVDTLAKRLVRARKQIRESGSRYSPAEPDEIAARLPIALRVLYLTFTAGYDLPSVPDSGEDLAEEAIRLARTLRSLLAGNSPSELLGLLALMLLHAARRASRFDVAGRPILLDQQDRSTWSRERIVEGTALVEKALRGTPGTYSLQAAIAAVHAEAVSYASTDWRQIVWLYDELLRVDPSPIYRLNRAAALTRIDGPLAALHAMDELGPELESYRVFHATRGALLAQLGANEAALAAYTRAQALTDLPSEVAFFTEQIERIRRASN